MGAHVLENRPETWLGPERREDGAYSRPDEVGRLFGPGAFHVLERPRGIAKPGVHLREQKGGDISSAPALFEFAEGVQRDFPVAGRGVHIAMRRHGLRAPTGQLECQLFLSNGAFEVAERRERETKEVVGHAESLLEIQGPTKRRDRRVIVAFIVRGNPETGSHDGRQRVE